LNGDSAMVKMLIEHGADINARDNNGDTPYMQTGTDERVLGLLLPKGALLNRPENGEYPIQIAVEKGDFNLALVLYANGANINAVDKKGMSVLHILAQKKFEQAPDWLAAYFMVMGAKVNIRDQTGKTPLKYALETGNKEIAAILKQYGGVE